MSVRSGNIKNLMGKDVYAVNPTSTTPDTIARPKRLDRLKPFAAAFAIGEFIGAPSQHGRWETVPFFIDEQDMFTDYMRAHGDGKGRWSHGYGEFIKLFQTHDGAGPEGASGSELWMTNTPQEIIDQIPAFEHATGRVLIHGLGLSCLVSGLLAKPDVTHIDVVEIDDSVISLVAPAYENENRVTIHQGNCIDFPWPSGTRWDYVWHDIWAEINPDNLTTPDLAEGGVTYEMLHRSFGGRCAMQGSWAYEQARDHRKRLARMRQKRGRFNKKWRARSEEQRIDMLIDYHVSSQMKIPGVLNPLSRDEYITVLELNGVLEGIFWAATKDDPPRMFYN